MKYYQWGTILISTRKAKEQLDITTGSKGLCLGMNGKPGLSIRVLRFGHKTPQSYHVDFWKETNRKISM